MILQLFVVSLLCTKYSFNETCNMFFILTGLPLTNTVLAKTQKLAEALFP